MRGVRERDQDDCLCKMISKNDFMCLLVIILFINELVTVCLSMISRKKPASSSRFSVNSCRVMYLFLSKGLGEMIFYLL